MTSPTPRPDVTVIVVVYNDAARVETAVRSVLDQSLRSHEVLVVDDHSSDDTPAVVARLVAQHPDRVRSVRLETNSGAAGRPRNVGIEQAAGRYVMFLDSDDVLDRHACRNLLAMAESSGADMVIGRCVRRDVLTGNEQAWMPWLVQGQVVHESLSDEPELLYDVLSTNKLYRNEFLVRENLRFPEGRLYEDNLFSAHAYLTAKKIAVIPQRIYIWNVERKATTLSITNRSGDQRNLVDRIAVAQEIDKLLVEYGTAELRLQKDIRFIENDLRTHLAGLSKLPEETRRTLVDIARPYLQTLDPQAFRQAKPLPAIAAYLARQGDYDGVAAAHDYLVPRGQRAVLRTDLTIHDGHVFWCDRHLDDPLGREILDVTSLGLQDLPLTKLKLGSDVVDIRTAGPEVTIDGVFTNPLGRIKAGKKTTAKLVFRDRRAAQRSFTVPVRLDVDAARVRWTARFLPGKALRPIGFIDPVYSVQLRLTTGQDATDLHLFAEQNVLERLNLPVRPRLGRIAADVLRGYTTDSRAIALRLDAAGRTAVAGVSTVSRVRATALGGRAWNKVRGLQRGARALAERRTTKMSLYDNVFSRVPIDKRTVVFESHMGKQFSDSPRAIYEELKRSGADFRAVWSYAGSLPTGFPADVKLVRRQSLAYLRELGRAAFWVDNQGFPFDIKKRKGTTYIQTWHGSAFKRMGFDEATIKSQTAAQQRRLQNAIDRFDVFLVRSEHDVRTLTKGLRVGADLMRVGYPRNDALVRHEQGAEAAELRRSLGLTDDRRVVLYAPTFRPSELGRGSSGLQLPFSLDEFVERFGEDTVLLVRPHYLTHFALPPKYGHTVRNAAHVHDVTPLLQISDALITDYSSLMFDYALLDRPMIFHVPDYEDYVGSSRGSYFELAAVAPGPLTRTSDDLLAAVADLDELTGRYADQRKGFVAQYGEYDTGNAAKAIVDRFFRPEGHRG
ncbi:CDP-glycerol glycerophosphotransferase family protein [Actinoplanes sp. NPDC051859]|uniref:bifunctional glycosyltransferase/CDP-glycerol:glycerophosphate glycerophosphotransferase n=1 Tax=Actinoplanes sp. NPDC051859 TaxID=3363909 RepID=UPI003792DCE2